MLEVRRLGVAVGGFRLSGINLDLGAGECHALLGPSGSGKSTFLKALLGEVPLETGAIRIGGVDVSRLPIEKRGLGYLPQSIGLFPHLTVGQNIAYSARARRIPPQRFQPLLDQLVDATGIRPLLDRRPPTLSGGERQRVGLVRALASQPQLVLLDEPFTALNESLRRELWWLLRKLQSEWDLTVLLITHNLTEAYFLAGRISILLNGKVVQEGDKKSVYSRPVAPDVARFLGVETLERGRILGVDDGLATVDIGGVHLTAVAPPGIAGDVLISIRGEDVSIDRESSPGGSARNRLPARVIGVQPGSPLHCVELDAGFRLFAFITRPACEELGIQPGVQVTATIKAPSVHLIPHS